MRVDQAIILVVFRPRRQGALGHAAALATGVVVGMHQAVIMIMVHRDSPLQDCWLTAQTAGRAPGGISSQAWWNCAASVLSFSAVVLDLPPLAACATASK